ncbi:hypothetical protein R3W88_004512 [Solanum pinnatisectum]|uniref:Retrotransposon gag domain-containing protein n=1 Tax=Solanum pinnatisectum TaxID=50273 RepID=A0AAV9KBN3_9SOLN|nr:hypothetical protein R3W88_004512 [Solanum pinnatisectum]
MPNIRIKRVPLLPYDRDRGEQRGGRSSPSQCQPISLRGRAQYSAHMMYEEDNADLDGAGATIAIVLPALLPSVKFTITSTMIQFLNLKCMFRGAVGDDENQNLMNFVAICKSQEISGVNQTTMRLRLFPLSLTGEASNWFSQKLKKFPNHDLTKRHLKQAFYRSLNYVTKPVVDSVCGGLFLRKSFAESMQLLDEGYNSGNADRNYARDGQYDRPSNRDQGNWQNRDRYRNDRSGVYVPPDNRDRVGSSSSGSKLEDMIAKVLQKVESTDAGVKEMRESQEGRALHGHATRSGKVLTDPMFAGTKHEQVLEQVGADEDETVQVNDSEEVQHKSQPVRGKEKEVEQNFPLQQIPRPPPPFHQRLRKKAEDGKFTKFITMLKQLSVNTPLVEALGQMPGYAKFMKDLVTKKRVVSLDFTNDVHHCSAIATRSLVKKKEDPCAFTIPCTIGSINFPKELCDLGSNINLMPLAIYKKLGLEF